METSDSVLFTYGAPFIGVLLLAVGIAAAVPGAYGLLQDPESCGQPSISVEDPERTEQRFEGSPPSTVTSFQFDELATAEQTAFEEAVDDAIGEAEVAGEFPNYPAFVNGSIISYEGGQYYATVVAENPCYDASALQFPLGVFAVALGIIGILTPPGYQKLIELEEGFMDD